MSKFSFESIAQSSISLVTKPLFMFQLPIFRLFISDVLVLQVKVLGWSGIVTFNFGCFGIVFEIGFEMAKLIEVLDLEFGMGGNCSCRSSDSLADSTGFAAISSASPFELPFFRWPAPKALCPSEKPAH